MKTNFFTNISQITTNVERLFCQTWNLLQVVFCFILANMKDWSQSASFFPAVFTRDCLCMFQYMLNFPESDGETCKLKKVHYIVKHFSEQFWFYYMPKKEVSIDESLIGFEGQAPAIQCTPNKHHYYFGFKLFCLCESGADYIVNF